MPTDLLGVRSSQSVEKFWFINKFYLTTRTLNSRGLTVQPKQKCVAWFHAINERSMGCFTKCDAFSSTLAVCNDAVWTRSASPPACDDILLVWKLLLSCQRFTYIVEYIYKITHCKDYKFRMSTTRILVFSLVNSICKSELQRLHSEHKVSECMKKLWKHDF